MMVSREEGLLYARLRKFKSAVEFAHALIEQALGRCSNPYIAYSTGKDSSCVLHLVQRHIPDVPVVYFDADCALPESEQLLKHHEAQGTWIIRWRTEPLIETFKRHGILNSSIEDITMKTTVYEPVKRLLDEYKFDACFMGLRSQESSARRSLARHRGAVFFRKRDGVLAANPILNWTYHDVWAYIHANGLPYNRAYECHGIERISYWAGESARTHGRYVNLKRYWPELYNRLKSEFPEIGYFG